jgi:hypothetical protein
MAAAGRTEKDDDNDLGLRPVPVTRRARPVRLVMSAGTSGQTSRRFGRRKAYGGPVPRVGPGSRGG